MHKIWQEYHIKEANKNLKIKCKLSIYEDINTLSFSYPFLLKMEAKDEDFMTKLEDNNNYIYVGYQSFDEDLILYIYLSKEEDAKIFEDNIYTLAQDHGWQCYYKDLYPSLEQWQSIENLLLCDNIEDLEQEQVLRHKLTFQSEYKKASLIEDLEDEEGFEIEEEFTNNEGYKGLYFRRMDKVGLEDIEALTSYLKKFLKIYDALYEGWEIK